MSHTTRREPGSSKHGLKGDDGLALLAVMIFAFILTVVGSAFFALSAFESRQAVYRENSSEAFYLADAGVERARGALFTNGAWRIDTTGVALGNGTYDLTVRDSTGLDRNGVYIRSVGHVRNADRAIEVTGKVGPGLPPFLVMNNADVKGNFCLNGFGHANGDADFGPNDTHFQSGSCAGDAGYDEGYVINPPPLWVDPGCFPEHTYYYVNVLNASPPYVLINTPTDSTYTQFAMQDSMMGMVNKVNATTFKISFNQFTIKTWFTGKDDGTPPLFRKLGADTAGVVVNFAGVSPVVVNLEFQGHSGDLPISQTIIDTRFTGSTIADRLNSARWEGGLTSLKAHAYFAPGNGIALAAYNLEQSNAQTVIGNSTNPGLVYVTHDVTGVSGDFTIFGAIIVLHNWSSTGGPVVWWYPHLENLFPGCYKDIHFGTTGVLDVFAWREVAAN